jgi:hypothetical protein
MDRRPTSDDRAALTEARQSTLAALNAIDEETLLSLTELTLPQIHEIQAEIARILPAGNLPALILNGLVQLGKRKLAPEQVRQDVTALFRGVDLLPQGLYGLFVAGPSAVLYAYQQLLRLAGKDVRDAFPQGTWQFYVEFALREDTARHTNETVGFHQALPAAPDEGVMAAAWIWAALSLLYDYDDLLAVDWRERVMLRLLHKTAQELGVAFPSFRTLVRAWRARRPYHRPAKAGYVRHRAEVFERFLDAHLGILPEQLRLEVRRRYAKRQRAALPAYQEQMTLLARLRPMRYREDKVSLPLWRASIGFVWQGETFLLPACTQDGRGRPLCTPPGGGAAFPLFPGEDETLRDAAGRRLRVDRRGRVLLADDDTLLGVFNPPSPARILGWVRAILGRPAPSNAPTLDLLLAGVSRREHPELRKALPPGSRSAVEALGHAPIIINWDERPGNRPLSQVRRDHRGVGDHALTVLRTDRSTIFDQSHIFFDGLWGMAVAEILTDAATHAHARFAPVQPMDVAVPVPLDLTLSAAWRERLQRRRQSPGVAVESTATDLAQLSRLRRWLKERGVRLTVNDVLLLYRYFHALSYRPGKRVTRVFRGLQARLSSDVFAKLRAAYDAALQREHTTNPALLVPMDATDVDPHERLFPTTFRNPLTDFPKVFQKATDTYQIYQETEAAEAWQAFDTARRRLLAYLEAFGRMMDAIKAVTMRGESFNTATLQLLGHLPAAMQDLLNVIPQRIGVLNEVLKGSEVFSNVGRVASGSSLRRFNSAKDDGPAKTLVWGVLTDDRGVLHLSLRDFRPFVSLLWEHGEIDAARELSQDYLDHYVTGLNDFVRIVSKFVAVKGPA